MKQILFGASGMIGQRILEEALRRGHTVTAVVRDPSKLSPRANVNAIAGDVTDPQSVERVAQGHDAAISAVGPGATESAQIAVRAARALIEGLPRAGVRRLLVVGGAGSLKLPDGRQLVDAPDFPAAYREAALAHRDALEVYRTAASAAGLDWTYLSPAAEIAPGQRTGKFRLGGDQLLVDSRGHSRISAEDYAIALLDEIERPQHIARRFTVAY